MGQKEGIEKECTNGKISNPAFFRFFSSIFPFIIICIHSWWQDIPICVMIKLWAKRPVFLYEKNLLTVEGTDCCEHRDVSQTTEEKIPWEGEFTIRSDPWAGLIASCGSFYPMVRCYLLLDTNRLSSTSLISNFCSSSSQDRYVQEHTVTKHTLNNQESRRYAFKEWYQ